MKEQAHIEVLARGVCILEDRLLVCHTKGSNNTYLPGGHVEFKEKASDALGREIREELGISCEVGPFLGAVEHSFIQKDREHCEINLVFRMESTELDASCVPESKEDYIEFRWVPLECIAESDMEPSPLKELIPQWLRNPPDATKWASTVGG
jgi:ADP-ribose pyrophosphatase YjhB (NUDIX family)